jgi:hypothetical protein
MPFRPAALAVPLLISALATSLAPRATAAAMSTGWEDFPGSQDECLQAGAARLRHLGYQVTVNPQTVFAWRGQEGVSIRCISERQVAAIFVYASTSSEDARLVLDALRSAYRDWRAPRPGGGGSKF